MDILDLPGWRLLEARQDDDGYRLSAEFLAEPDTCQRCGVIGRLYRHGTHATTYRDSPIRGHQVRIVVNVRRYKCRDCGETFRQAFDGFAASVPAYLKADFRKLLTSMTNWRTEILAVLDTPITNAYTEALNGVAKTINRTGKGYSFDVLRARLLFRSPGARIKFGPRAPLVPHNGPGSANPERVLRCMSCFGLFDRRVFKALHHIQPIAPLEGPIDVMALCSPCNARFHTD